MSVIQKKQEQLKDPTATPFYRLINQFLRFNESNYSMQKFPPMAAMYKQNLIGSTVWLTSRQSSKSQSLAAYGLGLCAARPGTSVLDVFPMFDQAKTFSRKRLGAIIRESPILKYLLSGPDASDAWDRKIMRNRSSIRLGYILTNPDRIRGESADFLNCDEVQEMDDDMLPIVQSCLDASELAIKQFTGTPLTTTNLIQEFWDESSQAQWHVWCPSCGNENIPSAEEDLLDMIGDEGPICAECGSDLDPASPEQGCWIHHRPERRTKFSGYHISHVILPDHYRFQHKWEDLLYKKRNWPEAQFYNEALGEPMDVGHTRLSKKDIQDACVLEDRSLEEAAQHRREKYNRVLMAADWGGKGMVNEESRTAYVVLGQRKRKHLYDVLWYNIFDISSKTENEMEEMDLMYKKFGCQRFAYDDQTDPNYPFLLTSLTDIPDDHRVPIRYYAGRRRLQEIMSWKEPPKSGLPGYHEVDKTRSLLLLFLAIKKGFVRFPKWEVFEEASRDLLSLEDVYSNTASGPMLLIKRQANQPDDFAMALNYGLMSHLFWTNSFPVIVRSGSTDLAHLKAEVGG